MREVASCEASGWKGGGTGTVASRHIHLAQSRGTSLKGVEDWASTEKKYIGVEQRVGI